MAFDYDPDVVEVREEITQLHRRARKAARTFEEQQRWEDDAPLRHQRLCDQLHAQGVRGWMPELRTGMTESDWLYGVFRREYEIGQSRASGWGDRREDTFRTRSWADACDSLEKAR